MNDATTETSTIRSSGSEMIIMDQKICPIMSKPSRERTKEGRPVSIKGEPISKLMKVSCIGPDCAAWKEIMDKGGYSIEGYCKIIEKLR